MLFMLIAFSLESDCKNTNFIPCGKIIFSNNPCLIDWKGF